MAKAVRPKPSIGRAIKIISGQNCSFATVFWPGNHACNIAHALGVAGSDYSVTSATIENSEGSAQNDRAGKALTKRPTHGEAALTPDAVYPVSQHQHRNQRGEDDSDDNQ
jgi:hypothetical protein